MRRRNRKRRMGAPDLERVPPSEIGASARSAGRRAPNGSPLVAATQKAPSGFDTHHVECHRHVGLPKLEVWAGTAAGRFGPSGSVVCQGGKGPRESGAGTCAAMRQRQQRRPVLSFEAGGRLRSRARNDSMALASAFARGWENIGEARAGARASIQGVILIRRPAGSRTGAPTRKRRP